MSELTGAELQELGAYDPAAADAEQRLALLEFLISTGASVEAPTGRSCPPVSSMVSV